MHRSTKFEKKTQFQCEFAVGTSSGYIVNVRTTGSDLFDTHVIREEPRDTVTSCAVHPNAHRLILGSSCGLLRVWDYGDPGDKDITAVAFDPTGFYVGMVSSSNWIKYFRTAFRFLRKLINLCKIVACGFASGDLCIVKAVDLTEETGTGFCDSFGQISFVEFSDNGIKMATAVGLILFFEKQECLKGASRPKQTGHFISASFHRILKELSVCTETILASGPPLGRMLAATKRTTVLFWDCLLSQNTMGKKNACSP
jgi:WD40 repeat protein